MAGRYSPADVFVFVDGLDITANNIKSLNVVNTAETDRTDGLGDSAQEHTPTGLTTCEISIDGGLWDTATARSHAAFVSSLPTSPQASTRVVTIGFAGTTKGVPAVGATTFNTSYEVIASNDELTKANATFTMTGPLDNGTLIESSTQTADWNTESASVDNSASSSSGGVGYQQVTAVTGFSAFVGKLRDSSDDASWADLITFSDTGSAVGAERAEVSGTIDRYVSFAGNVTGSGSITVTAILKRS